MRASGLRKFRRGSALVTVLMVVAIATVLSTAMLGSAFFNLNVSVRSDAANIARNLADSAIALAAEQALANPNTPLTGVITATPQVSALGTNVDLPTPAWVPTPQDIGYVTFAQSNATPWSTDNLQGGTSVAGWESTRTVPPNSLDLVGVGIYHGTQVVSEAIIWLPPYPYVMAGTGTVTVDGNLLVAGSSTTSNADSILANPSSSAAAALMLPADVGNNAAGAPTTMFLTPTPGASVLVTGNVQTAASNVQMTGKVAVDGQIVRNGDQIIIPQINIASYDTSTQPGVGSLPFSTSSAPLSNTTVTGYAYNNGDVFVNGNLALNGGVLYIQGDLEVTGSVTGKGAIFTTGNATINGNANLTSDDSLALVSGGNITLSGLPSDMGTPSFQGLLYTQGNLTASNIAIVGNYVANGGNTTLGNISLQNVQVISSQDQTTVHITPTATASTPATYASFSTTLSMPVSWLVQTSNGATAPVVGAGPPATVHVTVNSTDGTSATATYSLSLTVAGSIPSGDNLLTNYGVNNAAANPYIGASGLPVAVPSGSPATTPNLTSALNSLYYGFKTGPSALTDASNALASIQSAVNNHTWVQTGGGGNGTLPPNSPAMDFSFNQFLTPVQQARVLMWSEAVSVGQINP